jgi:hypothetical protein
MHRDSLHCLVAHEDSRGGGPVAGGLELSELEEDRQEEVHAHLNSGDLRGAGVRVSRGTLEGGGNLKDRRIPALRQLGVEGWDGGENYAIDPCGRLNGERTELVHGLRCNLQRI